MYYRLHKSKAVIGFTVLMLGMLTWLYFLMNYTVDLGSTSLSIILWWIGVFLILSWFKKERNDKLRIAMILAIAGQVTLWLFSESIFTKGFDLVTKYSVLFVLICWSISGLLIFSDRIRKYRIRYGINKEGQLIREFFSDSDKEEVLSRQRHRCAVCNRILGVVDFDHIDGNKSNNRISNCQALCPNCHAIKTRKRV